MGTLVELVQRHARERSSRRAYTFLPDGESDRAETLTFAELDARARALAAELVERGAAGQRVLVVCPAGLEYVVALVACFYAGAIAVPAYPPTRISLARTMPRLRAIVADCKPAALIGTHSLHQLLQTTPTSDPGLRDIAVILADELRPAATSQFEPEPVGVDAGAVLQYTSGSTSRPKGVLLTHRQVLANQQMIQAAGELEADDVWLSWLPPYHDMGLMGGILAPLHAGNHAVLMPPEAFIRKPARWLMAAQHFRASVLLGPNFAFDLCARRVAQEQRDALDLSSVRLVYNGAEPIHAETLDSFARTFAASGFRREAFYPCYGMAEATLIISGGKAGMGAVLRDYQADALEQHLAVPATPIAGAVATDVGSKPPSRRLVGCGHALLDEQIRIVDPVTLCGLPERSIGEIWVASRAVASGYWNRPEETVQTFHARTADSDEGPFLRTGDLGFFDQGELFITGRLKDLIIVRGLNHYPHDIERTVQEVDPALVRDAGAAFALDADDGEQLVVVQELDKRGGIDAAGADALLAQVAQAIREQHDLAPAALVLIKRGTLLKTSSGKVRRSAVRAAFLAGELQVVASFTQPASEALPRVAPFPRSEPPSRTHTRPVAHREQLIANWLRQHLAQKLKLDADAIDPRQPLARYGVDSLIAAELTEELERWLGTELPATISYDNPTIADLARALAEPGREPQQRRRRSTPELAARSAGNAEDPIAIVGMACRLPGAPDLRGFWSLLRNGVDAISEVPSERWDIDALYDPEPGVPGKICSRYGGFIERIDEFDAAFFGISAREAAHMDPQQRLFLELAWEALEDAAQSPAALAGSDAGVFAGVCSSDYAILYGGDLRLVDGDYGTGSAPSIVANRLSYALDLKGPSVTFDSACSSALVALQNACQSLRNLDCDLAIVGGVNAVLAPESSVYFSQLRALAPDGRCKAFDQRADGFVRSEGGGVVVLKRLSQALAAGDHVYALVAGGAINHDGRSNGLLAPSGVAQQEVVRRALHAAGIGPGDLDYVEAHGVGTPVADAVELRALGAVMAERPPGQPLLVGSAKTNVGHLEAASGMVSLIKVALALQHEELPPHLHLRDVHPDIGIDALPIEVPTLPTAWPRGARPRFAGVSAFGFGGTNAHVVLREAPALAPAINAVDRSLHVFALSARSESALRRLCHRMAGQLAALHRESVADVCFSANAGRAQLGHRLALCCADLPELRDQLTSWAGGTRPARAQVGEVKPAARLHVGFAFHDGGAWIGGGGALYASDPRFKQTLELCSEWLRPQLELPLLELLYGADSPRLRAARARPSHAQAALVSLQYAMYGLLRAVGLEPIAVYGAGAGEYAAAAATGVLSWQQAITLAARRGLLHEALVQGAEQTLSVRQLRSELAAIDYLAPSVPFVSASLGRAFTLDEVPDETHWGRHLYHAPAASDAHAALFAEGCHVHLEVGPCALPHGAAAPDPDAWLPTLAAGAEGDDLSRWLETLGALYVRGAEIDWRGLDAPYERRKLSLPTYPFERERHWLDFPDRALEPGAATVIEQPSSHPLFSRVRIRMPPRSGFSRKSDVGESGDGQGSVG